MSFSSTKIEHINQKIYNTLCDTHKIAIHIDNLYLAGKFYPGHGAFYVAIDEDRYEYSNARKLMDKYISA